MAIKAPTLIAATHVSVAGFQATTTPKETEAELTVKVGDVLVAYAECEESTGTANLNTPTGLGLTWTLQQRVLVKEYEEIAIWTAKATEEKKGKLSFSRGAAVDKFGGGVLQFRGSAGIGHSAKTNVPSGAPSLGLTPEKAHSAIVMVNGDWEAKNGTTKRTYREPIAFTEEFYSRQEGVYTIYAGYYADAVSTEARTVGITEPTAQKYSIVAVEVLGEEEAGGETTFNDSGTGTLSLAGTGAENSAGVDGSSGTGTLAGSGTETAEGNDSGSSSGNLGGAGSDSLTISDELSGSLVLGATSTESFAASDQATGALTLAGSGAESREYPDAGTAGPTAGGSGSESWAATDAATGTMSLTGSGVESYEGSSPTYNDSGTGTLSLSGTGAESATITDARTAALVLAGIGADSYVLTDLGSGTLVLSGSGIGTYVFTDSRSGALSLAGTSTESSVYIDSATGHLVLSGSSVQGIPGAALGHAGRVQRPQAGTALASSAGAQRRGEAGAVGQPAAGAIATTSPGKRV